ncbi:MAG: hypothetical protein R3245_10735 [Kiloniellales bacterium]|nr:hypothetical protein [Kiloniellales bacterium]
MAVLSACGQGTAKEALTLTPDSLERRQLQTRIFETDNEAELLSASAALLQDLGFNLDESEVKLGVLVGSKERDATDYGQEVMAFIGLLFTGVLMPTEDEQKIRASIVTRPLEERKGFAVRLTMQRIVWNDQRVITRSEALDDPKFYQDFFAKLSKAVFLEAQEL